MIRKCIVIDNSKNYSSNYDRYICVDEENANEIYECIESKRKKWKVIIERTLTQPNIYWDSYAKEKKNDRSKNVTAIKFFDKDNTRIYCQELSNRNGQFYIICAVLLLSKKTQKNDNRINEILKKISNYEYEIIQ